MNVQVMRRGCGAAAFHLFMQWFELKKLVGEEDATSALLRGEDKYPHMVMVLALIEPRLKSTRFPVSEKSLLSLSSDTPPTCSD